MRLTMLEVLLVLSPKARLKGKRSENYTSNLLRTTERRLDQESLSLFCYSRLNSRRTKRYGKRPVLVCIVKRGHRRVCFVVLSGVYTLDSHRAVTFVSTIFYPSPLLCSGLAAHSECLLFQCLLYWYTSVTLSCSWFGWEADLSLDMGIFCSGNGMKHV
jgi:hypothetical protein